MTSAKCTKQQIAETLVKKGYTAEVINETMANNVNTASKYANIEPTNLLAVAQAKLNAVIAANPYVAVAAVAVAAIMAVVAANKIYNKSIQESIDKSKELVTTFKQSQDTFTSNASTISTISKEYETLARGVDAFGNNISLTEEEFKRYHEITSQIADMFPTMVQGYDEQGNAILKNKGNVEALTEALKQQQNVANQEILNNGEDVFKGVKNETKQLKEDIDDITNAISLMNGTNVPVTSGARKILKDNDIEKRVSGSESDYNLHGAYGLDENATLAEQQKYQDTINKLVSKRNTLLAQQEEVQSRVNTVTQAYLNTNTAYAGLDDMQQTAISSMASALDPSDPKFNYDDTVMQNWIFSNLIVPIKENKDNVQNAISGLFSLDPSTISSADYKQQVDEYVKNISDILDVDSEQVKIALGVDVNYNQVSTMLKDLKDTVSQDVFDNLSNLNIDDLKIAYNIENVGDMTWDEIFDKINKVKEQASQPIVVSFAESVKNVSALSNGLDQLDKIYADIKDKGDFDFSNIVSDDFVGTFSALGEDYDNFIETIATSPDDIKAVQSAFDKLVGSYINQSGVLDDITDATKAQTVAQLKQMGVENAEEIAMSALTQKTDELVAKKLAASTPDFANMTAEETAQLASQSGVSEHAAQMLNYLAIQKTLQQNDGFANLTMNETNRLLDLANAANMSAESIKTLSYALKVQTWMEKAKTSGDTKMADVYGKMLDNITTSKITAPTLTMPEIKYTGGAVSNKPKKETKDKSNDELQEIIDGINKKSEELEKTISNLKEQLSFEELLGNTENINKINSELSNLFKLKPEVLAESNKQIEALKAKYKSAENVETIESAIDDNYSSYLSARTEGMEHEISLIQAKADKESEVFEQTRDYYDYLRDRTPEVSLEALKINDNELELIQKQLDSKQLELKAYYDLNLTDDTDEVKAVKEDLLKLSNEKYELEFNNIDLRFDIGQTYLEDAENLKSQLEGAIQVATADENEKLAIKLNLEINKINLASIDAINKEVKNLQQLRSITTTDKEYENYTVKINSLLEQRTSIIEEQISKNKELAKIQAENSVYGSSTKEEWEKSNETEINTLQKQIDAINKIKDAEEEQAKIEEKLIEIQKLEMKLQELQSKENIQILKKDENGEWQWDYIADYKEIAETEKEITTSREELQDLYEEQRQQAQINSLKAQIDELEEQKKIKEDTYEEELKDLTESYNRKVAAAASGYDDINTETKNGLANVSSSIDIGFKNINDIYGSWMSTLYANVHTVMEQIRADMSDLGDGSGESYTPSKESIKAKAKAVWSAMTPIRKVFGFSTGGLNTSSGWQLLHGTQDKPERVLSAEQTKAYETMVSYMPEFNKNIESLLDGKISSSGSGTVNQITIENIELPAVSDGKSFVEDLSNVISGLSQKASIQSAK